MGVSWRGKWDLRPTSAVLVLAGVWPLGAYAQAPYIPLSLGYAAAFAVGFAMLYQWRAQRKRRPPFEYWWPPAAMVLLAALLRLHDGLDLSLFVAYALFFLGPIVLVQSRADAALACAALAFGSAISALASVAAQAGVLLPTAIDIDRMMAFAGPEVPRQGILLLFHALLAGLFAASHPQLAAGIRKAALAASIITGSWLLIMFTPMLPALAMPANLGALLAESPAIGLIAVLALWLVARVAARSALRPANENAPPSKLAPALIGTGTSGLVLWGAMPDPGVALFIGLIAAHDAPWSTNEPARAPARIWVPILACIAIQLAGVLPLTAGDPRNHAARCASLLAKENWRELDRRLDFLLGRYPAQPAYSLLRARALAAQGWPEAASQVYCSTIYPEDNPARYGISFSVHRQALMDALRDQASRLPVGSRGLFFERALVHAGELNNALRFLALQSTGGATAPVGQSDTSLVAAQEALALLLGDAHLLDSIAEQVGGEAPALLSGSGVEILSLPEGIPEVGGAVLVRAVAGPQDIVVDLWPVLDPSKQLTGNIRFSKPLASPDEMRDLAWNGWAVGGSGRWEVQLSIPSTILEEISLPELVALRIGSANSQRSAQVKTAAIVLYIP